MMTSSKRPWLAILTFCFISIQSFARMVLAKSYYNSLLYKNDTETLVQIVDDDSINQLDIDEDHTCINNDSGDLKWTFTYITICLVLNWVYIFHFSRIFDTYYSMGNLTIHETILFFYGGILLW